MKEKRILVIRKEPGKAPEVEPCFPNELEAFQEAVGGYIETVTFADDACVIYNEEGRLMGLPFNCEIVGVGFAGTVLIVGIKGEEFASLRAASVPLLLKGLGG